MVNFVTALAYDFCLGLPAAFTQPGDHLLAESCTVDPLLSLIPNLCGDIESSVFLAIRRATAAAMEKKSEFILNNDISDLEKTLNSIGVYGNERKKGQATVSAPSGTIDHNEFLQSSQYRKVEKSVFSNVARPSKSV